MSYDNYEDENEDDAWKEKYHTEWNGNGRIALDSYPAPKKGQSRRYAIFRTLDIVDGRKVRR